MGLPPFVVPVQISVLLPFPQRLMAAVSYRMRSDGTPVPSAAARCGCLR